MEIAFTVYDLDGTVTIGSSSSVVDNIIIPLDVSSSATFSETRTYSGNLSRLQLAFRLTCGPDSYGPHCTYCVDTNDTTGHFTCDPVSGKVCLEGYQNPQTNCTECIPGQNCGKLIRSTVITREYQVSYRRTSMSKEGCPEVITIGAHAQ